MMRLRPHHGLCLLTFAGKGYSRDFVRRMARIQSILEAAPHTELTLTSRCDDICSHCPNRECDRCRSDKPERFDANLLDMTGLYDGQTLTWHDLSQKTRHILHHNLQSCCDGCEWLPLCTQTAQETDFIRNNI